MNVGTVKTHVLTFFNKYKKYNTNSLFANQSAHHEQNNQHNEE